MDSKSTLLGLKQKLVLSKRPIPLDFGLKLPGDTDATFVQSTDLSTFLSKTSDLTTYGKQLQKQLEDVTKESSSSSKRWNTNNLFQRNDRPVVRLSTEEKRLHRATVVAILRGLDPAATDVQCQVAIAQWEFAVYGNLSTDRSLRDSKVDVQRVTEQLDHSLSMTLAGPTDSVRSLGGDPLSPVSEDETVVQPSSSTDSGFTRSTSDITQRGVQRSHRRSLSTATSTRNSSPLVVAATTAAALAAAAGDRRVGSEDDSEVAKVRTAELLQLVLKLFQIDPETHKTVINLDKRRIADTNILIDEVVTRIAAIDFHPIYTRESFPSQAVYDQWRYEEVCDVALRVSGLPQVNPEQVLARCRTRLTEKRKRSFVGQLILQVIGVGGIESEPLPERQFGFEDDESVIHVSSATHELDVELLDDDRLSVPYMSTQRANGGGIGDEELSPLRVASTQSQAQLPLGRLALSLDGLMEPEGSAVASAVLREGEFAWDEKVFVSVSYRWAKQNYYSLPDHYGMFQMLARKVIEYDLSHLDRSGFPSTVCRALLDIYGQRYGVRASYREIIEFRILSEKMINLGIDTSIMLTALSRMQALVGKRVEFFNRLEVDLLVGALKSVRQYQLTRLSRYRYCFPTTMPLSHVKDNIEILRIASLIIRVCEPTVPSPSFSLLLRDCVRRNISHQLDMLLAQTENLRRMGKATYVVSLAETSLLELEADRVYYKNAFPVNSLEVSASGYFTCLAVNIQSFLSNLEYDSRDATAIFRGYFALQRLNEAYVPHLDSSAVAFPVDQWYRPYFTAWMGTLRTHLTSCLAIPISPDTWLAVSQQSLHSVAIAEVFVWLTRVLDFLGQFQWTSHEVLSSLLTDFADIVCSAFVSFTANLLMYAVQYQPWQQLSGQEQIKRAVKSFFKQKPSYDVAVDKKFCQMMNSVEISVLNLDKISQSIINLLGRVTDVPAAEQQRTADELRDTFQRCHDGIGAVSEKLIDIAMLLIKEELSPILRTLLQRLSRMSKSHTATVSKGKPTTDPDAEIGRMLEEMIDMLAPLIQYLSKHLYDRIYEGVVMTIFRFILKEIESILAREEYGVAIMQDETQRFTLARTVEVLLFFFNADGKGLAITEMHAKGYDQFMNMLLGRKQEPAAAAAQ